MDEGRGAEFVGKSLNEIDINPEVAEAESDASDNDDHDELSLNRTNTFGKVMDNFKKASDTSDTATCKYINSHTFTST